MPHNKLEFSSLILEWTDDHDCVRMSFKGDIDEGFKGDSISLPSSSQYFIDAHGINNFNSCGIREWTIFIDDLQKRGRVVFEKCSVNFIDQINMVPESMGNGEILSFYAPYYCATHGEIEMLLDQEKIDPIRLTGEAPKISCDKCKNLLEFDALEESFFLFLKNDTEISHAS